MSEYEDKITSNESSTEEIIAPESESAKEEKEQENYYIRSWLWILIPVFIILFLISCFMVGTLLYNMATLDRYAVQLGTGVQGELELFNISYDDVKGQIIVEGTTGEDLVAPGIEVNSTIRVENPINRSLDYVLTSKAEYYNEFGIPIEVKLIDPNGNYILGGPFTWVDVMELNSFEYKGKLRNGEFDSYNISWRWKYETGFEEDDLYDTFLGNIGGAKIPGITVAFYTEAITSPSLSPRHFFLHKNFFCCLCCYLVWLLLFIALILQFYNIRYRKKLKRAAEDLERYAGLYGPLPVPGKEPEVVFIIFPDETTAAQE